MKNIMIVAALSLCVAFSTNETHAQSARCLTPANALAMAQSERPSTEILAQHDGAQATAILESIKALASDEVPEADAITVLRSAHSSTVLIMGSEEGCLAWRGQFPTDMYEHAVWKAIGQPI